MALAIDNSDDYWNDPMRREDRCPKCIQSLETPKRLITTEQTVFAAAYRCRRCSHEWVTNWSWR